MNESHWTVESILKKEQRQCHSAPLQSSSVLSLSMNHCTSYLKIPNHGHKSAVCV